MKLYKVTFINYTNPLKNAVKDSDNNYIDTSKPLIIKETDIEKIMKYGNGIKELEYVGDLKEF